MLAVLLALVPSAPLTTFYLLGSGFFATAAAPRATRGALTAAASAGFWGLLAGVPNALHRELFAIHAGDRPLGRVALVTLVTVGLALSWAVRAQGKEGEPADLMKWRRSVGLLALFLLFLFVLTPDHLGAQGGFLRARLAPVPFLLGLALLPLPPRAGWKALAAVPALALLGFNFHLVHRHLAAANREIEPARELLGRRAPGLGRPGGGSPAPGGAVPRGLSPGPAPPLPPPVSPVKDGEGAPGGAEAAIPRRRSYVEESRRQR
jgi:hypothetical protein